MTKRKQWLLAGVVLLAAVTGGLIITAIVIAVDKDTRSGFKKALSVLGFSVEVKEKPTAPRIGSSRSEVESFCGTPDDTHSFETARAKIITTSYKESKHSACNATFTFINGRLDSISR